ncbi:mitoguardin-like [Liolophura sinensis]|uniref:mitoguardin-like n=1 Tax=Liolophura sinensis TaxID=3198878 RepID=UPI00315931B4
MDHLKGINLPSISRLRTFSTPTRLTVMGVSVGIGLIALLAVLFRRRRGPRPIEKKTGSFRERQTYKTPLALSPNGDLPRLSRRPGSPGRLSRAALRQRSMSRTPSMSSVSQASTISTLTQPVDTSSMPPPQLCELGLETFHQAITYWEDALTKMSYLDDENHLAIPDADTSSLQHQIEYLLDASYRIQDEYERRCCRHADQLALDTAMTAITEMDGLYDRSHMDAESMSDQESFVSARDLADLSDLESHRELFQHLALYEAGLMELKHGNIPCRTLRPDMADCLSDTEFLAKLHCIRLALEMLLKDGTVRELFSDMGRDLISDLLVKGNRDPDEFRVAYDAMMDYVNNHENWEEMEEELRGRGVKCLSFYDVALDFILMDAFDDLETPPSSVLAVVQNRWLSNGFKETALSTAVWSVLKAKRRLLRFPNGFISHFYVISEHVSPVLAWGFLGPECELKDICFFFKDLVLSFIRDIFSFEKCRYTTLEELSADILRVAKEKNLLGTEKLSS